LSTIDKVEVEKFSKIANDWWNPNGKFKPLHIFNPARIKIIKDKIISYYSLDPLSEKPLSKVNILDIGCGGGLLCEPLKRLGAEITGIDASENNIKAAKLHAQEMDLDINYINCSPENLKINKKFKVILNMEIVEHVSDVNLFIQKCSSLIEKNGIMFVATINKNIKSYLFAIIGAEYILRWLPIGTHDWNKFLTPEELKNIAEKNNFVFDELIGMKFNLLLNKWKKSKDSSVNYITTFLKS
tara:strand:- start:1740 stop:2465 length:726 start_codon:yes stop_codon:yes gene_type:complete